MQKRDAERVLAFGRQIEVNEEEVCHYCSQHVVLDEGYQVVVWSEREVERGVRGGMGFWEGGLDIGYDRGNKLSFAGCG